MIPKFLPFVERQLVINGDDASDRIIAGVVFWHSRKLAFVRGNGDRIDVPFDYFTPSGDGTMPDFSRMKITDYGHTVALGEYEASTDGILYEFSPEYRERHS